MGNIGVDHCTSGAMQSYGHWWTLNAILRIIPRLLGPYIVRVPPTFVAASAIVQSGGCKLPQD